MQDNLITPEQRADQKHQTTLIELKAVSARANDVTLLSNIDLKIETSAPTILMGPNGSGKTTLLRVMMGLIDPSAGSIDTFKFADGTKARCAIVFQKPVMLKRTAAANVALALSAAGYPSDPKSVLRILDRVGLSALGDRPARKLSGGEQQRVALARALAREPDILFLDEPTASLDPAQTKVVEEIVATIAASGIKIVMATHDIGQARRLAGEIVFLVQGRLVEHTPAAHFFSHPETQEARRFLAGDLIV